MSYESAEQRLAALQQRVAELSHAIQSGVAFSISTAVDHDYGDSTPKHLRTGLNIVFCQQAGLTHLLIEKGVITEEEYWTAQVSALENEVHLYEERYHVKFA